MRKGRIYQCQQFLAANCYKGTYVLSEPVQSGLCLCFGLKLLCGVSMLPRKQWFIPNSQYFIDKKAQPLFHWALHNFFRERFPNFHIDLANVDVVIQ
jgi:hypothetical protein